MGFPALDSWIKSRQTLSPCPPSDPLGLNSNCRVERTKNPSGESGLFSTGSSSDMETATTSINSYDSVMKLLPNN